MRDQFGERQRLLKLARGEALFEVAKDASRPFSSGEQTIVGATWPPVVEQVNATRALAWSNRRLIVENDTIATAAEEFNRRNRVQLVVDPALGSQRVLGQFHADDPASFAQSIAISKKDVVVHRSRDVILLQPAGQPR